MNDAVIQEVKTTCPYCGVGCGVVAKRDANGGVKVVGDVSHPANRGRLCSKGNALGETLSLDDRLLYPEVNGQRASWEEALDEVADSFKRTIEEHGADSVALYVSGQILTEDYYVANKLMKGYIGTANIDTNSRLCMSTAVAGHKRAFGTDTVPACYEDLELADLLIIVGSNLAWAHPVLYQRLLIAKKQRPEQKIVVVDPRKSATCDIADLHLPLKAGSDASLYNGLLAEMLKAGQLDREFVDAHTENFSAVLESVDQYSVAEVCTACGISETDYLQLVQWLKEYPRTVTLFSQGINQSSSGVDKVNTITNLHLATGRIGLPGASPFSITGQPNAMGGREVGGLANQLAAHMDFDATSIDRVQRFWNSPTIVQEAGLKAVDLFDAIEKGEVKAVWIMSTNPVVSLPEADRIKKILQLCPTVIVSDCVYATDTTETANILLPAAAWGEKDGTVTNSERCVSHQKAFLPMPGEAKPDWWAICEVAKRLGYGDAFSYESAADIFREHAALSAFENNGDRDFNLAACASLSDSEFANLVPFYWPAVTQRSQEPTRFFADGHFYTANKKARFFAIEPRPPQIATSEDYPLVLNTGRGRDQWHTMTRTAKSARLNAHLPEPFVEVHPTDADTWNLIDGGLARVHNVNGDVICRVKVTPGQQAGNVFIPIHWTAQYSSHGRVSSLVHAITDPISGQPESKQSPVSIEPWAAEWQGFILSAEKLVETPFDYWVRIHDKHCQRYIIANKERPSASRLQEIARSWITQEAAVWLEYQDSSSASYRGACFVDGRLHALVVMSERVPDVPHAWLSTRFNQERVDENDRRTLLSGRSVDKGEDPGATVCSCFGVGINTIRNAIQSKNLTTVEQVGACLSAGTNCGSCKPEINELLATTQATRAAS